MIIAKNDEAKRSKIWRIVTLVSSVLIIVIAIFLLTKLFTANPLEGTWVDEDRSLRLSIKSNGTIDVNVPEVAEDISVGVDVYKRQMEEYSFINAINPIALAGATFHCIALFAVFVFAVLTGWGREYEGPNGERIKAKNR